MKIALVTPLPDPQRWSMKLYERTLWESLKPLLARGESVELVPSLRDYAEWVSDLETITGKLKRYFQQYFAYGLMLRKMDADIFHITDHAYGNLIPFLKGRKIIVTFHDALLPNLANRTIPVSHCPKATILSQRHSLNQLPQASRVITVSNFSREECLHYSACRPENVIPVYSGVSEFFFKKREASEIDSFRRKQNVEGKVILIAGRTDAHKNMEGSIEALKILSAKYQTPFTIFKIGANFTARQKQTLKQSGLMPNVRYLGSVKEEDLPLIYQSSDALLFLSFYEGFGFPSIEAMASGIPAVLSNRSSLPEVGGDAALFADPTQPAQAAEALFRIFSDIKLCQEIIDKGKARAASFQWKKTAEHVLQLYRKVYRE